MAVLIGINDDQSDLFDLPKNHYQVCRQNINDLFGKSLQRIKPHYCYYDPASQLGPMDDPEYWFWSSASKQMELFSRVLTDEEWLAITSYIDLCGEWLRLNHPALNVPVPTGIFSHANWELH